LEEGLELGFAVIVAILALLGRIYVADFVVDAHIYGMQSERKDTGYIEFARAVILLSTWILVWGVYIGICVKALHSGKRNTSLSKSIRLRLILGGSALFAGLLILADMVVLFSLSGE